MKTKNSFSRISQLFLVLFCALSSAFGKIHHLKIPSVALADSNRAIVATPTNFDWQRKERYPFIVMLHGWSGDETQWDKDADLQLLSDKHDVLLILPDGGYDGWWIDTELAPGRDYGKHLHQEIKIWVVENFNGSKNAFEHGIMGLSMGGFGALNQVLKHPGDYAAAASLSGVMDVTRHTENWHLSNALGVFSENPERWERSNPLDLAKQKAPKNASPIFLVCGRDDFAFAENQDMEVQLTKSGYPCFVNWDEGTHSHAFWQTHVESAIDFLVSHFE